jgi:hypothetical protein
MTNCPLVPTTAISGSSNCLTRYDIHTSGDKYFEKAAGFPEAPLGMAKMRLRHAQGPLRLRVGGFIRSRCNRVTTTACRFRNHGEADAQPFC